jgi:hypothetical protein
MKFSIRDLFLVTLSVAVCVTTHSFAQDLTVPGPEANGLASQVDGYLVRTRRRTELIAMSLPKRVEKLVRRTAAEDADFYPTFHAISGPDSQGRLVYIEDHFFVADTKTRRHLLKQIQIDGTGDTTYFSRAGSAMWACTAAGNGEIGTHLGLSPVGGKIAFVSGLKAKQMPKALLHEGSIEIWDAEKKLRLDATAEAINQPLSWFPDGKRLAYVKLAARDSLDKASAGMEAFGKYFGEAWADVPAIYILDVTSGRSSFLHVGWTPVVSCDGKEVYVGGWDIQSRFSWLCYNLESRKSTAADWQGDAGGPIAIPTKTLVLFKGLPTATSKQAVDLTERRMISLKVATTNSRNFQTLVRDFDPRDLVSFGRPLP